MSYGLRNTLILLVVLLTFIGGGWGYIYFYQKPEIKRLKGEVQSVRQELKNKQQVANQYPVLKNRFEEATNYINNYEKALYPTNNEDNVFEFLNTVSSGSAYTNFTFNFSDSTSSNQYGVMTMKVTGDGYYRNFYNFIRQIELNKPLNKISRISINPINELESYGKVNFTLTLQSYYDRVKLLGDPELTISNNLLGSVHNPFYPLIRSVSPNENNLVNVEESSLIAISGDKIFLLDQKGVLQKLSEGDDVYLGELSSINIERGTATFKLNKGGIIQRITLRVNNDENKSSN